LEVGKFKAANSRRGHNKPGLRSLVEACSNVRSSIPARYLGLVCLPCALKQLELLGASLFGICTILGRDRIGINELLRRIGTAP
jgi:hypothetical protein